MAGTDTKELVERIKVWRDGFGMPDSLSRKALANEIIAALSPVQPEDVQYWCDVLRGKMIGPARDESEAADLIERLARDKVMRDEAYQALCEEGLQMQARIEELESALLDASQSLSDAGFFLASTKAVWAARDIK